MRVLVIDQNIESCHSLEDALKKSGYTVISARNSIEALDILHQEAIDFIVSRTAVPGPDVSQLICEYKSNPALKKVPHILHTSSSAVNDHGYGPGTDVETFLKAPALLGEFLYILKSMTAGVCATATAVPCLPEKDSPAYVEESSNGLVNTPDENVEEYRVSDNDLRFLFDTMQEGVVFHDLTGCITHANPAAESILGLPIDQMKGRTNIHPDGYYIHEDGSPYSSDTHPAMVALKTGAIARDVMGIYNPPEKRYRWIRVTAVPQFRPGGEAPFQVYSSFVDITEQKVSSERTAHLNRVLLAITGINKLVMGEHDPGALARKVCRLLVKERDYIYTWIIRTDVSGNVIEVVQEVSEEIGSAFVERVSGGVLPECVQRITAATGVVSIRDSQVSCGSCPYAPHIHQGRSFVSRLEADGITYGFIGVATSEERVPDRQEQDLFREIANGIAFALHHINTEIIELETISALKESEEKFRQFAENIDDVFWMSQPGLARMLYVSPAFEAIWGRTLENFEALPACLIKSVHPDDKEALSTGLDLHAQGKHFCVSYRIIRPDGSIRWIRDRGFPVLDRNGACRFMLGLASDITEVKTAETALKEELDRKKDFLSIASHELRTPLQPIVGYLHLILDNPCMYGLNDEGLALLREMQQSVAREVEIVNRMLEVSLLDFENEIIKPEITDVYLLNCIKHVIRGASFHNQAEFNILVPPELSIKSDVHYLYEVLTELISNAVRYSRPPRLVTISYYEDPLIHVLSVTDNGVGMDEKTLKNLFRPFYTPDSAKLSRTFGRLGLGLTIAKKRIEMLKGDITIRSSPGDGTMATILLPKRAEKSNTSPGDPGNDTIVVGGEDRSPLT